MAEAKRDNNRITTMLGVSSSDDATPIAISADETTKRMRVDAISEEHGHGGVNDGTVTLTNAGTAQQLPDVACKRVYIECSEWNGDAGNCPNGGAIVIGGANVVAALATRRGKTLYPTQGDWFKVSNLNLLYFDGLDDGAKLNYFIEV